MRTSLCLLAVIALCGAAACAPAAPPAPPPVAMQGTADDEAALRGLAGKYTTSFNANDAAALAALVSEDFENISADGTHTKGRAAFRQREETGIKERAAAKMTLTLSTTTGYLNWIDAKNAVIGGTWTMAGLPAGAPDKGAWIVVCAKSDDGQWLMRNSLVAEAPIPPPPPATGR